jgi:hypothetical protein
MCFTEKRLLGSVGRAAKKRRTGQKIERDVNNFFGII